MDAPSSARRNPGRFVLAFVGRFLMVLSTTVVGTVLGMVIGAYRANSQTNSGPAQDHATMGMETAGVVSLVVWGMNLLFGGAMGLLLGLLVGVVGMLAYRWARPARQG